jgi:hypothetical protein
MQANSNVPATKARASGRGRVPPPSKDLPGNGSAQVAGEVLMQEREQAIAQTAYYMAEMEGFPEGKDLEYWFRAEAEYEQNLAKLKQ